MDNQLFSRRVAVTGSTGMIGSHLVAEMVRAGYTDIVLPVRNPNRVENIRSTFLRYGMEIPEGVLTVVETDLTDPEILAETFQGVDAVFNCAAAIMTGELTAQQLIDNNVTVARSVAEASVRAGVRRVIHTSSIIVLQPGETAGLPITEDNRPHYYSDGGPYARSKYLSELEMHRVEEHGVGLTVLYPAVVLGEGDWSANGSSAMVPIIALGQPFYTHGVMAYTDVRDAARAYICADQCLAASGQDFIVAGSNLSYKELFTLGAGAAGRRKPFIGVGRRTLLFGYGVIKMLTAIGLLKDMSIKRSNINSMLVGNRYSGEKLTEVCGFQYTPIEETAGRIVKAYIKEKKRR